MEDGWISFDTIHANHPFPMERGTILKIPVDLQFHQQFWHLQIEIMHSLSCERMKAPWMFERARTSEDPIFTLYSRSPGLRLAP